MKTLQEKRAYFRKYRAANREKIAANQRNYYWNNRETELERNKAWKKENPGRVRAGNRARRWKEDNSYSLWSKEDKQLVKQLYNFRDILNKVHQKVMFEIDHIIPLAAGGEHAVGNLALATANYNSWKGARLETPETFLASKRH